MPSLVLELQRAAQDTKTSVTDLLRMVKVIAAKLDLTDITEWVEHELGGYDSVDEELIPSYRQIRGGDLQVFHPTYGWRPAGHVHHRFVCAQSVAVIDQLVSGEQTVVPLTGKRKYRMRDEFGVGLQDWPQQLVIDHTQLVALLSAIRDRILDWSLELEKRGIMGENMSFKEQERQAAAQNITIQNFKGVLGDVSHSHVEVHDYSTIHQTLRDHNVPQAERNEIENIMDDLKKATPAERPTLIERGKAWVVRNKDFLGASAALVRKALGLPEAEV